MRVGSPTRQYLPYVCNSVNKGCGAFWHEGPDVMSSVLWTMIIHLAVWGQRSSGQRRRVWKSTKTLLSRMDGEPGSLGSV